LRCRQCVVVFLAADGAVRRQRLQPRLLALRLLGACLVLLRLRPGLRQRDLERGAVCRAASAGMPETLARTSTCFAPSAWPTVSKW
jgi:hypothetical protein